MTANMSIIWWSRKRPKCLSIEAHVGKVRPMSQGDYQGPRGKITAHEPKWSRICGCARESWLCPVLSASPPLPLFPRPRDHRTSLLVPISSHPRTQGFRPPPPRNKPANRDGGGAAPQIRPPTHPRSTRGLRICGRCPGPCPSLRG